MTNDAVLRDGAHSHPQWIQTGVSRGDSECPIKSIVETSSDVSNELQP